MNLTERMERLALSAKDKDGLDEVTLKCWTPDEVAWKREHGNPFWKCWAAVVGEMGLYCFGDTAEEALWQAEFNPDQIKDFVETQEVP